MSINISMGRPKGSKNKDHIPVVYPRVCDCGYSANNPAMWSYHRKTHDPIPEGQLCDHGCGRIANYRNTKGTYTCTAIWSACPKYLEVHAYRIKKQWATNDWQERRIAASQVMANLPIEKYEALKAKSRATKRAKLYSQPQATEQRHYRRQVHRMSGHSYELNKTIINPNNLPIGRSDNHLDHRVSKHVGWILEIPPIYLASIHNLQILDSSINESKGFKCDLHPLDLLTLCSAPKELIETVQTKLAQLSSLIEPLLPSRTQTNGFF